jgi:hypothetical protein
MLIVTERLILMNTMRNNDFIHDVVSKLRNLTKHIIELDNQGKECDAVLIINKKKLIWLQSQLSEIPIALSNMKT